MLSVKCQSLLAPTDWGCGQHLGKLQIKITSWTINTDKHVGQSSLRNKMRILAVSLPVIPLPYNVNCSGTNLKFREIHIQGTIKPKRGSDWRHNLTNQAVQISVRRPLDIEVPTTDVINSLVINHECAVGMLQGGMGSQDGVVGLDHSSGDLRCWVDSKLQFGLLAVVNRKALHEERGKARSCTTPKGMKDQEALKATALVGLRNQTEKITKNQNSDRTWTII